MTKMPTLLWLAGFTFLTGCVSYPRFDEARVVSVNPFLETASAQPRNLDSSGLEGTWVATNQHAYWRPAQVQQPELRGSQIKTADEKLWLRRQPPNSETITNEVLTIIAFAKTEMFDGYTEMVITTVEPHSKTASPDRHSYLVRSVKLADWVLIDLTPNPLTQPQDLTDSTWGYLPIHSLMRVRRISEGKIEVGRLNDAWLRPLLSKRRNAIRHILPYGEDNLIVVTDSSEAIERFLRRHAGNLEAFTTTTFFRTAVKP